MKYIMNIIQHDTGEVFIDGRKVNDNERYAIVEADNLQQASEIMKSKRYCPICDDYTAHVEDIVLKDVGWKIGETIVCDNCMAGQRNMERVYEKAQMLDKIIDIIKTGRNLGDNTDSEIILMAIEHELEYLGDNNGKRNKTE